jgi:hypothetical protein
VRNVAVTVTEEQELNVLERKVVWRTFVPKRKEETGARRKFHNKELHNLNSPPNYIGLIKYRRIRWMRHAACIRNEKCMLSFDGCRHLRKRIYSFIYGCLTTFSATQAIR